MLYYHVTNRKNIRSILSSGLKSSIAADGCKTAYIYLWSDLLSAQSYAAKCQVVLSVDISGVPDRVIEHLDDNIVRIRCSLKPERIKPLT